MIFCFLLIIEAKIHFFSFLRKKGVFDLQNGPGWSPAYFCTLRHRAVPPFLRSDRNRGSIGYPIDSRCSEGQNSVNGFLAVSVISSL